MKILVAAGPRTGSHAFCQIQSVDHDLSEIMNIEDCILPRLEDESIDFSICSKEFIEALEKHDWETAWHLKPNIADKHHLLHIDEQLNKIQSKEYLSLNDFLNLYNTRWENIKKLSNWCIKILQYQAIPQHVLDDMLNCADKFYVLNRRNKIAQALSMTKATMTQLWHGTVENPIIANAGNIDYKTFSICCRTIRHEDKWLEFLKSNYDSTEQIYYEDLDLSESNYTKNHIKLIYEIDLCKKYWDISDKMIDTWFKEFISNYDWTTLQNIRPTDGYFKMITDPSIDGLKYWNLHLTALKAIDIDNMPKDLAWLDVGIWFGIMPFVLQENGFTNIETTDCAIHRIGNDEYFNELWSTFKLTPREMEIRPKVKFNLGKTYDLITIMKSNVFWKTEEVIHYDGEEIGIAWQNHGSDGKYHTYFSVYNKEEWEFFVENIKEFLNPGGIAVVNPEPWVYDKIASCAEARDYLKQFQIDNTPTGENYSNYLIIRK
jgi:hypothetical protein